jgi:hypothetical protein
MEFSFSRLRDHSWKIPVQNNLKNRIVMSLGSGIDLIGPVNALRLCSLWVYGGGFNEEQA